MYFNPATEMVLFCLNFQLKKDGGPPRRSPSLKFRRNSPEKKEVDAELTDLLEETAIVSGGNLQTHKWSKASPAFNSDEESDDTAENKDDINHNHQVKNAKMAFLNIHENQENEPLGFSGQFSPDRSPVSRHKPTIPPLDLSILHENMDGSGKSSGQMMNATRTEFD